MSTATEIEGLLRELAPQVLGPLVRRYSGFDTCEDALQEALLAAALQWPAEGVAIHDEAASADQTDWRQILGLYELLERIAPGPMVTLSRIVAVAMVDGPQAGLEQLAAAAADPGLAGHHRVDSVRAHLLEMTGDREAARAQFRQAARRTLSVPERRYLESRAAQLSPPAGCRI